MHVLDPVECLYLALMLRWQRSAPPDQSWGRLDGELAENSQVARLAYALKKISVGQVDETLFALQRLTAKRDGSAYISRQASRMTSPHALWDGWYLEGCMSLAQKLTIVRQLRQLGLSPAFVESVAAFVAGETLDRYLPTAEEQDAVVRRLEHAAPQRCHSP